MSNWPALGHGVAGVDHQVDQHLLDHADIGLDERRVAGITELQVNVLADDAFEHLGQVADRLRQVERLGLHDLLAAKGEQLPGQAGRAVGGGDDLFEALGRPRR